MLVSFHPMHATYWTRLTPARLFARAEPHSGLPRATPTSSFRQDSLMYKGLEHTAIASPDPRRLAQWYVDHLGFHINFEYAGNYFVKAPNGSMLEIIPSEGERTPQEMKSPGIRHLAIAVDSFDAAHEDLKAKSVNFLTDAFTTLGNRLVFFTDA